MQAETHPVTNEQIHVLRTRARRLGDVELVELCDRAIIGERQARRECADIISGVTIRS